MGTSAGKGLAVLGAVLPSSELGVVGMLPRPGLKTGEETVWGTVFHTHPRSKGHLNLEVSLPTASGI